MKWNPEQFDLLSVFATSDYYKLVLSRLKTLEEDFAKRLVTLDMASASSDRQILQLKSELEGAKKLIQAFQDDLTRLKIKKK